MRWRRERSDKENKGHGEEQEKGNEVVKKRWKWKGGCE